MEQWTIDARELIRRSGSKVTPEILSTVDECVRSVLPLTSSISDFGERSVWRDVSDGLRGLFIKVLFSDNESRVTSSTFEALESPPTYAEITAKYQYWTLSGVLVEDHTHESIQFVCGAGEVTPAMEEGVMHMKVGETAVFVFDPTFGFRDEGLSTSLGTIGTEDVGILLLVLLEIELPLDDFQRRERARELKDRGNAMLTRGPAHVLEAERMYHRALKKIGLHMYKGSNSTLRERDMEVRVPILSNLQQCALLRKEYQTSLRRADQLLKVDPTHEKGLYRKAVALSHVFQHEMACECLQTLLRHYPACQEAIALLKALSHHVK